MAMTSRFTPSSPVWLLLSLLTGCTYITPSQYEASYDALDQDDDGVARGDGDCDDNDGARFPGNPETAYDGVDNDCDGFDLVDVDGDGFPGVTRADFEAEFPDGAWPPGVAASPADCADDPAVIADAALAFPTNPSDLPYDGIDADCAADNDFDQDADGDMPSTVDGAETAPLFEAYVAQWGYASEGSFGDCDDFDEDVFGGAPGEVPYDGEDTDCAGDNDFDVDADGWMSEGSGYEALFDAFVARFHDGVVPDAWAPATFGDCDDAAADVNPDVAPDAPYDGVDADCAGDDDFDADKDGFVLDEDCDDDADDVNPEALEALGDTIDQDCDGGVDTAPFAFGSYDWAGPRPPRVVRTTDHWVVASTADSFTAAGQTYPNVGVAFALDELAGAASAPVGSAVLWQGVINPAPLADRLDLVALDDTWTVATAYTSGSSTYLIAATYAWDGVGYARENVDVTSGPAYQASGVDLVLDSHDEPWAWACGEGSLQVLDGDNTAFADFGAVVSGTPGVTCFVEDADDAFVGTATTCDGATCESWQFDDPSLTLTASQPWAAEAITYANHVGGWTIAAYGDGAVLLENEAESFLVAEGLAAVDVDAVKVGSTWYLAILGGPPPTPCPAPPDSCADGLTEPPVHLLYGDPEVGALTDVVLDFEAVADQPTGVGLAADGSRVVLAATSSGALGWMVVAP